MEGSLWRQKIGSDGCERDHARRRAPTITSRTSRRTAGASSSRATTARPSSCGASTSRAAREHALTAERRRQPRAAHLAGRPPDRLRFDRGQRPFQPEDRRPLADGPRERALSSSRRARAGSTATTIRRTITSINPSWSPDGQARVVRHATRRFPGARAGSARSPSTGGEPDCLDRHQLEIVLGRAAGGRAGRQAHPLLQLPRRPVAPALADDDRRRGAAAAHLRRVRPPQRTLVAGRQAHRLHQQRERQHGALGAGGLRRRAHRRSSRRTSERLRRLPRSSRSSRRMRPASRSQRASSVLGSDGRWHAPRDAWMHGDELYDRAQFPSEVHYFHCPRKSRLQRRRCRRARRRSRSRAASAGSTSRSSASSRPARRRSCRSASRTTTCRRNSASSSPPTCTCT